MAEEEKKQKEKRPTAAKRILQSIKRNQRNSEHKSKIRTVIKNFNSSIEKKENKEVLSKQLSQLFSLLDKAKKSNIFTQNKIDRLKATYSSKI